MICSHCGQDCQTTELIPICSICSEQSFLQPLNQKEFSYRREQGQIGKERRGEIVRKIGQGRLGSQLEIIEGAKVFQLPEHWAFRDLFISNSSVYQEIQNRKNEKKEAIHQVKSSKRNTFLKAFGFMAGSILIAKFGYENEWFVFDVDLESKQTENLFSEMPLSFQEYLNEVELDPSFQEKTRQEIELVLVENNRKNLLNLKENLEQELKRAPRQSDELLLYLQTSMQLREVNPAFGVWLMWAQEISSNMILKKRVLSLWAFYQSDRKSMKEALVGCAEDDFCKTMSAFLNDSLSEVKDGFSSSFILEQILRAEDVEQYGAIADQIEKISPENSVVWALRADDALLKGNFEEAKKALEKCLSLDQTNQQAQTWSLQLGFRYGTEVDISSWVVDKQKHLSVKKAEMQAMRNLLLARYYYEQKNFEEAKAKLEAISDPRAKDLASLLRSRITLLEGKEKESRIALKEVKTRPKGQNARLLQGLLLVELGDLQAANTSLANLEALGPHHWMLNLTIAIETKNLPLLKKSLVKLSVTDLETIYLRNWEDSWVPQIPKDRLFLAAKNIIRTDIEKEKWEQMLEWCFQQQSFQKESLAYLGNSDAAVQAILTQSLIKEEKWTQASKTIQRAKVLAPTEELLPIIQQIVNAGVGRKDIASRELELLSQKERSKALFHWFWKGFSLAENTKKAKEYEELFWTSLPNRIVTQEYQLVWEEKEEK